MKRWWVLPVALCSTALAVAYAAHADRPAVARVIRGERLVVVDALGRERGVLEADAKGYAALGLYQPGGQEPGSAAGMVEEGRPSLFLVDRRLQRRLWVGLTAERTPEVRLQDSPERYRFAAAVNRYGTADVTVCSRVSPRRAVSVDAGTTGRSSAWLWREGPEALFSMILDQQDRPTARLLDARGESWKAP